MDLSWVTGFTGLASWNALYSTQVWQRVGTMWTLTWLSLTPSTLNIRWQDANRWLWGTDFCEECSIQARYMFCKERHNWMWVFFFFNSSRIRVKVQASLLLQKLKSCFLFSLHLCYYLRSTVNKYLRQSSSSTLLYQRDSKSSLGCIRCYLIHSVTLHTTHTHARTHFTFNTVPTQPARLPPYFITRHVTLWDMVPDFIYAVQWWLSYLCRSEIAVDQCR